MSAFKQKPSPHGSGFGQPLPFRSREATNLSNLGNQHVSWAPTNPPKELKSDTMYSSADKENVKSWLDSTSPTSVLKSQVKQQPYVQREGEMGPPTPSPVCSPSPSSPLSSPRSSAGVEHPGTDTDSSPQSTVQNYSDQNSSQAQSTRIKPEELGSTSRRNGKEIATEVLPDSPTGSSFSSGSEGGLLALLASKLLSYKENGKRFSRYARESSGPIDEKHVMEDRSQKPSVEEIHTVQPSPPPMAGNDLYRTTSEAVSEISLGSANDRTLSMEFDAMLAAAVATGIGQAAALQEQSQRLLPNIQEDVSTRAGLHNQFGADSRALVRVETASADDDATRLMNALTVMRQGGESEDMDFNSTLSEFPVSTRSSISSGSRRGVLDENNMQIVSTSALVTVESPEAGSSSLTNVDREASLASSSSGSNTDRNSLAMVLAFHDPTIRPASEPVESMQIPSAHSSSISQDRNIAIPIAAIPPRLALEKVKRNKALAQALAFQDAQSSKCNNRYKREESKIIAWENQQKINAGIRMKKVEMKLEQKRAKAIEKMQNEIARAHKAAEERKASAEAVRASKTAKVALLAESIRRTGKGSSGTNVGCFPF